MQMASLKLNLHGLCPLFLPEVLLVFVTPTAVSDNLRLLKSLDAVPRGSVFS